DMVLLRGSDEVFKDFQAELSPFTVDDFHRLRKYEGILRITADKKDHVFQARLLEPASMRLPSFPVPDLGNRFGMTKEEIIRRARETLLPLYQKESPEKDKTAKEKVESLLRRHPKGLAVDQISEELGISPRTFYRVKEKMPIMERKEGNR